MNAKELRRFREERRLRQGRKPDRGHIVERDKIQFGPGMRSGDVFRLVVSVKFGKEEVKAFRHRCEKLGIGYFRNDDGSPAWLHEGQPARNVTSTDCFGKTTSEKVGAEPYIIEVAGIETSIMALLELPFIVDWHYVHSSRGHRWNDGVGRDRTTGVQQKPAGPAPKDASASVRRVIREQRMQPEERRAEQFRAENPPPKEPRPEIPMEFRLNYALLAERVAEFKAKHNLPADKPLPEYDLHQIIERMTKS